MGSQAWKDHERKVATFFKTKRRSRGDDFGRSDVEVVTTIDDWLGIPMPDVGIVVECKYSKHLEFADEFFKLDPKVGSFIMRGSSESDKYIMCYLNDFEKVLMEFVLPPVDLTLESITDEFSILSTKKRVPGYIEEFHAQARAYLSHDSLNAGVFLPIVCMAKAKKHGQIVSISMSDIDLFQEQYGQKSKERTDSVS